MKEGLERSGIPKRKKILHVLRALCGEEGDEMAEAKVLVLRTAGTNCDNVESVKQELCTWKKRLTCG